VCLDKTDHVPGPLVNISNSHPAGCIIWFGQSSSPLVPAGSFGWAWPRSFRQVHPGRGSLQDYCLIDLYFWDSTWKKNRNLTFWPTSACHRTLWPIGFNHHFTMCPGMVSPPYPSSNTIINGLYGISDDLKFIGLWRYDVYRTSPSSADIAAGSMTSLFYRLYPKDAAIPDHTVTPAARWAKILANGGTLPEKEDDGSQTQEETISGYFWDIRKPNSISQFLMTLRRISGHQISWNPIKPPMGLTITKWRFFMGFHVMYITGFDGHHPLTMENSSLYIF